MSIKNYLQLRKKLNQEYKPAVFNISSDTSMATGGVGTEQVEMENIGPEEGTDPPPPPPPPADRIPPDLRDNFRDIVENKLSVSERAKIDPEMTLRQYMELKAARKAARDAERGQTGKSETEDESAETSVDAWTSLIYQKQQVQGNKRRTKKRTTGPGPGSTRSNDSLDTFTQVSKGEYGMSRMLTHVVKPISVLLDPEKRESQVELLGEFNI
jgi:hypothetical protein